MVAEPLRSVAFFEVGRDKKSWVESMRVTHAAIVKSIRKRRALISRDIEVEFHEDGSSGNIYAGTRPVGRFTVTLITQ